MKQWKVGFTCGAFDLLHAGHVLALKEAAEQCEELIVGLQSDPTIDRPEKNKPVQTVLEREIQLRGCRYVADVWRYDTEQDLLQLLVRKKIDVRILGADWKGRAFTGHRLHIPIYYNSRDHSYSSSDLRRRIYDAENSRQVKMLAGAALRGGMRVALP